MNTTIILHTLQESIIDLDDLPRVSNYKWYINSRGYAMTNAKWNGTRKIIMLHRFIMNMIDSPLQVDHINHIRLDNRKENLRAVTRYVNQQNCDNPNPDKGISLDKRRDLWKARITVNGKEIWLGYYANRDKAKQAYDVAKIKYHI